MRNPAIIGPAASPTSQIVPNTPMAAPKRRAEARSAISALVTGVTAAMPKPSIGATMTKVAKSSLRKISGSAAAHRRRPMTITGFPTQSIREAPAYRLRNHRGRELAAQDLFQPEGEFTGHVDPDAFVLVRDRDDRKFAERSGEKAARHQRQRPAGGS